MLVAVGTDEPQAHVEARLAAQLQSVVARHQLVPVSAYLAVIEHDAKVPGSGSRRSGSGEDEHGEHQEGAHHDSRGGPGKNALVRAT